jgi:hypothetical protein
LLPPSWPSVAFQVCGRLTFDHAASSNVVPCAPAASARRCFHPLLTIVSVRAVAGGT